MKICDRCIHREPVAVIRVMRISGVDEVQTTTAWELCEECATEVWQAATREAGRKVYKKLDELCPSLTPDQARQVEQYIEWRLQQ